MYTSKLTWKNGMTFTAENRGLTTTFDVSEDQGGSNSAPNPKEILLNAMCACSAMDVVSIARKMRTGIGRFTMEASAEKTKTIPAYFASAHLRYLFEGQDLSHEKIIQAIALSLTKYCGVSYMVSKTTPITYEVVVNGTKIHEDKANFQLEVVPPEEVL